MEATPIDYSDIPPLNGEFFKKATAAWPPPKRQLTIRLDADVLDWLKANGRGYQTRLNHILRAAMEALPRRSRSAAAQELGRVVAEIRQEVREKGLDKKPKREIHAAVAAARRDSKKPGNARRTAAGAKTTRKTPAS